MQPIFSRNDDIDKIAFLNWRISKNSDIRNLMSIAEGYLSAAVRLARLCLITNKDKSADMLIFPILNNANHGIEIYLKAIMWTINLITGSEEKAQRGHNIRQLYRTVRSKVRLYNGAISMEVFDQATLELKLYLDELFLLINATDKQDNMDFSRYPFSSGYQSHFYVEKMGNVVVDLENFVKQFEHISIVLDNIASSLYYDEYQEQ